MNTVKPQSSPQDIQRAVEILSQSQRPVMVAGNGVHVSRCHANLQKLAETWGMPVATSYKGKSAIAETHPLSLGMVGVYGQDVANRVVGDADTVLVVGAKLTPQDTVRERPNIFDPHRQRIIQIDIDERNAGWTFPVELGLIGDAGSIVGQLVEASGQAAKDTVSARREWTAGLPNRKQELAFYDDPEMHRDSSPVTPPSAWWPCSSRTWTRPLSSLWMRAITGPGWPTFTSHSKPAPSTVPAGTAGMGWRLPAAVALKLVYPDRPVACVTGDGGFMMTVHAPFHRDAIPTADSVRRFQR